MLVRLPTGGETAEPEVVDMQAHTETGRRVALSLRPQNGRWSSIPHLNNSSLHHLHITAAGRIHQQRAHAPVSSLRGPILRTAAGNHPTIRHPPAPLPPAPDLGPPSALSAAPSPAPIIHVQMCTRHHTRRLSAPNVSSFHSHTPSAATVCAHFVARQITLATALTSPRCLTSPRVGARHRARPPAQATWP